MVVSLRENFGVNYTGAASLTSIPGQIRRSTTRWLKKCLDYCERR